MCRLICLLLLCAAGAAELEAQRPCRGSRCERVRVIVRDHAERDRTGPPEFGVRAGYDFEASAASAGAQLRIPLLRQLLIAPSADVFFEDAATEWQLNADLLVRPDQLGGVYAGAGAALARRDDPFGDDDVEPGFNLLVGVDAGRVLDTRLRPFVEGRWSNVGDADPFRLVAGFNVPIR